VGFCSLAHTDEDIDRTLQAAAEAAKEVAATA
jgi:glutamate-1-semialdehyde aminotransferase